MADRNVDNLITALQEINVLVGEWYETQLPKIGDFIEDLLITAYLAGREAAEDYLEYTLETEADIDQLDKALNLKIEGETYRDRIDKYLENGGTAYDFTRIAETEFHRMYNTGLVEGGGEISAITNTVVNKTWVTAGDDRVRDTHDYLEGMTVPINEPFFTYDGDFAMAPGDFAKASNNVNCRCTTVLSY